MDPLSAAAGIIALIGAGYKIGGKAFAYYTGVGDSRDDFARFRDEVDQFGRLWAAVDPYLTAPRPLITPQVREELETMRNDTTAILNSIHATIQKFTTEDVRRTRERVQRVGMQILVRDFDVAVRKEREPRVARNWLIFLRRDDIRLHRRQLDHARNSLMLILMVVGFAQTGQTAINADITLRDHTESRQRLVEAERETLTSPLPHIQASGWLGRLPAARSKRSPVPELAHLWTSPPPISNHNRPTQYSNSSSSSSGSSTDLRRRPPILAEVGNLQQHVNHLQEVNQRLADQNARLLAAQPQYARDGEWARLTQALEESRRREAEANAQRQKLHRRNVEALRTSEQELQRNQRDLRTREHQLYQSGQLLLRAQQETAAYQRQIARLQTESQGKDRTIARLQGLHNQALQQNTQRTQVIADLETDVTRLRRERDQERGNCKRLRRENRRLESDRASSAEVAQLRKQVNGLLTTYEEQEAYIRGQHVELQERRAEIREKQRKLDRERALRREANAKYDRLASRIEMLTRRHAR